jgi:hypothetical protein
VEHTQQLIGFYAIPYQSEMLFAYERPLCASSGIRTSVVMERRCPFCPSTMDVQPGDDQVRFVPIVLQKSFCLTDHKFSGL